MDFLREVFVKFWRELIVAVLLMMVLPFVRRYVRRQRAKMLGFFKERERLREALRKAEELAESERIAREELERRLEAETERRKNAQSEVEGLCAALEQEREAHKESERLRKVEAEENRRVQEEAGRLLKAAKESERFRAEECRKAQDEIESLRDELARQVEELRKTQHTQTLDENPEDEARNEEAPKSTKKSYDALVKEIIDNHTDLNHIYDCLDIITADYSDVLREKYAELFDYLYESRPHTIIPLFAHHGTRPYYTIERSKLEDDILGVRYVEGGKKTKIFDTRLSRYGIFEGIYLWPDEIKGKANFLSKLKSFASSVLSEGTEKYPYIRVVKRKLSCGIWVTIEAPEKTFMPFYENKGEAVFVGGTYIHHKVHIGGVFPSSGAVEMKSEYLPIMLPIFEGLDVAGIALGGNDIQMAYIEAR